MSHVNIRAVAILLFLVFWKKYVNKCILLVFIYKRQDLTMNFVINVSNLKVRAATMFIFFFDS